MAETQQTYTLRAYRKADLESIVDLINLGRDRMGIEGHIPLEAIEHQMALPVFRPETDFIVAESGGGQVVGGGLFALMPDGGRGFIQVICHPDYERGEMSHELVQEVESRFVTRAEATVPPEEPIYLMADVIASDDAALAQMDRAGYEHIRDSYRMRLDFAGEMPPAALPDGLTLRPFERERDTQTVYEVQQEVFADHWGYHPEPFDVWTQAMFTPYHDPTLWFIAYDGETMAGFSLCHVPPSLPTMGWVHLLGVRRAYRRRGLGEALLRHSFHVFQSRGLTCGGLGVDAASKTNAVALYQRVGMHIERRTMVHRKIFRGRAEDIQD